jgi:type IV secretory pathway ATPase VirB11/archaellum biosynthesis ATPase
MPSLRSKLSRRKKVSRSQEATQVIFLDTLIESVYAHGFEQNQEKENSSEWTERYRITDIREKEVLLEYQGILRVLKESILESPDVSLNLHIKEALLSFFSMGPDNKNVLSRTSRKEIFRRLRSLLQGVDMFVDILADEQVRRILLTDRTAVRVHRESGAVTSSPMFYCREENEIFCMLLSRRISKHGTNGIYVYETGSQNILVEEILCEGIGSSSNSFLLRTVSKQGTNLLELIRSRIFSPAISRSLAKIIKEKESGIIISGVANTGKSRVVSALLSALPFNRVPLIIGKSVRIRTSHPNAMIIDSDNIEEITSESSIEEFTMKISRAGVTDVFIDDLSVKTLPFLIHLVSRYNVYPVVTIHGRMEYTISNVFSANDSRNFVRSFLPVLLDMGDISDECSLKGMYEIILEGMNLNYLAIAEKNSSENNWSLSGIPCESARYFDTLKMSD